MRLPGHTETGPSLSRWARSPVVREGGVEPPRPCGHWNLNPARLPIPPPAHWVCLRAAVPRGPAPSDTQNISTLAGVDSHRFSRAAADQGALPTDPGTGPPPTPRPTPDRPTTDPRPSPLTEPAIRPVTRP